jgi:hypothetical protein
LMMFSAASFFLLLIGGDEVFDICRINSGH